MICLNCIHGPAAVIELRHLRTLLAIEQTGKLSEAAARVHLTQSALSHQVRALESEYGLLFDRTPKGVAFTSAGLRLLELAKSTLENLAQARRDIERMRDAGSGELRIALECHTCFDWLMPVMDRFRKLWPEVELDLVAGFHSDPMELLADGRADIVIGSRPRRRKGTTAVPLFRFEMLAVLPVDHALRSLQHLEARDFAGQTLITYPVPENRIDLIREVLKPARIRFKRRTAELTVAILQLVASRRGIAALPSWGLGNYLEHDYVIGKRIGRNGLHSELYATGTTSLMGRHFAAEFVEVIRQCARELPGVTMLR